MVCCRLIEEVQGTAPGRLLLLVQQTSASFLRKGKLTRVVGVPVAQTLSLRTSTCRRHRASPREGTDSPSKGPRESHARIGDWA